MISVYNSNEKLFNHNGIKILKPLKAVIIKEDNGDYYLDMKDTIDNLNYYQGGMIIRAPTKWGKQSFRIGGSPSIENNKINIRAKHVYFDTANYLIEDSFVVNKSCNDALDHLAMATDVTLPFTTLSDISVVRSYRCVRKSYEEAVSDVLDNWGGHLIRNNWNIEIRQSIGEDRGVTIEYAKNIKDIKVNENWDNVVTKILPVGKDGITLDDTYVSFNSDFYDIPYSKVVKFEQDEILEENYTDTSGNLNEEEYIQALKMDLQVKAMKYLQDNYLPKVNYTLSAYLKNISDVGDIIYVKHPKCKVDITTQVISLEYDVIREQYTKVEFGNFKNKLKNIISSVKDETMKDVKVVTESVTAKMQDNLEIATQKIKDTLGGSYVIMEGDKVLIVDKLPKENATNVIMINSKGIGFSQSGINGTFISAWAIDGTLDMQNINTINLIADMIKGGTLKLGSNLNGSGIIALYDTANNLIMTFTNEGLVMYCTNGTYIKLNPEDGFCGFDSSNNKIYWADGDEFHMRKSVVEEEITIANKLRIISIQTDSNNGVGFVALV